MEAVKAEPVPAPAPAATDTVLRLHDVLRQEHRHLDPAPPAGWWQPEAPPSPAPPASSAAQPASPRRADPPAGVLILEDGKGLAARITLLLVPPAAALDGAKPGAAAEEDRHYRRLAEWVLERRTRAPAEANARTGEVTAQEIADVLADKTRTDLPHTEPWLRNAELRPFTRGLLKRHLERSPSAMMRRMGKRCPRNEELNRLLLEDAFAKYVRRRDDELLSNVLDDMRDSGRAALCLSGGGIRSATFALGVVQGLARHGMLGQFRYLSTVSGGGYLGSWLSAWSRHEGMDAVIRKLDGDESARPTVEAAPVRHLRQYSNFLSPRLGVLSADTWTLGATFLRNLILIWLVLVPLLAFVAGLPWLVASLTSLRPSLKGVLHPAYLTGGLALAAAAFACRAVSYVHAYRPETDGVSRRGTVRPAGRDQSAFLRLCLAPLALAAFLWAVAWRWFSAPDAARWFPDPEAALGSVRTMFEFADNGTHPVWSLGTLALMGGGAAIHLTGWLFALRIRTHRRTGWRFAGEMGAIVATGAVAGLLLVLTSNLLQGLTSTSGAQDAKGTLSIPDYWEAHGTANAAYATLAVPGFLTAILLAGFAFEGLASEFTEDGEREWSARYSAWVLVVALGWLAVAGIVLFGPVLLREAWQRQVGAGVGVGAGILTAVLGRSPGTGKSVAAAGASGGGKKRDWGAMLSRLTLPLAAVVGVVALAVGLSFLDMAILRWSCSWEWVDVCKAQAFTFSLGTLLVVAPIKLVFAVLLGLYLLGQLSGRLVETNRFSLHAMYRARLIRAYLGASRPAGERQPDPFTGFDEADNLAMGCVGEVDAGVARAGGATVQKPPFHVLNLAMNLVAGRNLAWQERKAASFTVSPLHAGAQGLGYRRTRVDGQQCPPVEDEAYYGGKKGITLGTAMTISGAAASPNMGYHSSPAVTFLMTLFNARLGWWLGNPGPAGDDTFHLSSPRSALRPLLDEMMGATDDTNPYVYLSDGGHFENLGLYEMVLRRNRFIVVSDAGCDEDCSLQDLGNAIRKIRIDQGIPIEFDADFPLRARSADPGAPAGRYWAFARIRYSCVDTPGATGDACDPIDGVLLYIKPGIYGGEPRDVFNYAAANPAFPHESTADQFFSESQFESYRALGSHAVEQMVAKEKEAVLKGLFTTEGQTAFFKRRVTTGTVAAPPPAPEAGIGRKIKIDGILQDA